ncbi:MAG: EamA family transporter RarD [Sphingomicrobium sp.]
MNRPASPITVRAADVDARSTRIGFVFGLAAYAGWGVLPLYFKLLKSVEPVAIVAHRICWSVILLAVLISVVRGWGKVRAALAAPRTAALLGLSAVLIATNWLLYVYAVNNGHILAGSLGYYLNPIANILLGRFVLKESLSRLQWAAVALAVAGIAVLAVGALGQLWISLILCASFATYGLVRKTVAADALTGLGVETAFLFPLALGYLVLTHVAGAPPIGPTPHVSLLLALSGIISTVPLLLFTAAARRLPYSTMGMLQFLAPTMQFLIAVFVYGEPFTRTHAIAFAAIWGALILYIAALVIAARRDLPSDADSAMFVEC